MRARIGCFCLCAAIASSLDGVAAQAVKSSSDALAARVQVYDQFVREGGRWKFKRHQIGGTPPAASTGSK